MAQKDNILQELKELNSSLAGQHQNVYSVPDGYFDGLIATVISRIKAMEAGNAAEELAHLSPVLSGLPKQLPYTVPSNYFEGLAARAMAFAKTDDNLSAQEELESLSPLLGGLKKEISARPGHSDGTYTVPQGYFETLTNTIVTQENKPVTKVISLTHRKWFRYAAAAVITGMVAITALLVFNKQEKTAIILAKVKKEVKKMDETQKENLINFIDAGMNGDETAQVKNGPKTDEIKTLLQGISDEELKDFEQQTEDLEEVLTTD